MRQYNNYHEATFHLFSLKKEFRKKSAPCRLDAAKAPQYELNYNWITIIM